MRLRTARQQRRVAHAIAGRWHETIQAYPLDWPLPLWMARAGWTVAGVEHLAALAWQAVPNRSAVEGRSDRRHAAMNLLMTATEIMSGGWALPEALSWAAVLLGTTMTQWGQGDVPATRLPGWLPLLPVTIDDLTPWRSTLEPLAPLAWAAGLSPTEAAAHAAAGTLDETNLRLLAGLRGQSVP